jgi:ATP-dependent Clp protease ATP-binding subunit ClpA
VYVPEPSVDETYQILLGLRERYEAHHKLRYTDEALDAAAKYSHQYISDRWALQICSISLSCASTSSSNPLIAFLFV